MVNKNQLQLVDENAVADFESFSRNNKIARERILQKVDALTEVGLWQKWLAEYDRESQTDPDSAYPSQGLIQTPYDSNGMEGGEDHHLETTELDEALFIQTIHAWLYYLELFNHPARLAALKETQAKDFKPPTRKRFHPIFLLAKLLRQAIAINELALHIPGSDKPRIKRTERFLHGPFVKLGKYSRSMFVGSANPDIWGNAIGVASMAQSHCLTGIPRDGFFADIERQADYARKVFELLAHSPVLFGREPEEQAELLNRWQHNLMGVLEATPNKALRRAQALYNTGIRTFRIYSPEPGDGPLETLKALRQHTADNHWEDLEIFVGQVTSVSQAQQLENAGATGLYIGIGGGGRCTTGVRSNSAIDWPQLLWDFRGKIKIPVIVEGGASDNIGSTVALGATGIGVTRIAGGGTIESPGGYRYFINQLKELFKPYGGEASARMKFMGGRVGPFDTIPYVEGESTKVFMEYGRGNLPTMLQRLHLLFGDAVMNLVFQSVETIEELQEVGARNLRKVSVAEQQMRKTH